MARSMDRFHEPDLEKILRETQEMVRAVEAQFDRRLFSDDSQAETEALARRGAEVLAAEMDHSRDGACDLVVAEDGMSALADFYPPAGSGKPLTLDQFVGQLDAAKVTHGRLMPVIETALRDCALNRRVLDGITVAVGTPPVAYQAQRWQIDPALTERKKQVDETAIFLDFKTQSPFVLVKKGDLLARRIPEQPGSSGVDVRGTVLDFARLPAPTLIAGDQVTETPEGYVAACDGSFRFQDPRFWVDKVLVLDSGVDYATGNIDFAGDVNITGEIAPGFHIHAGGAVASTRVIDATEVVCGGDLTTPLGIIGRQGSVVKAEGRIRAKFLENCFVLARGAVEIQTSTLNCWIQTMDRVVMGEKGLIVGGKIQSLHGIDTYQIGTERSGKAELICGMDVSVVEKVEWAKTQTIELITKLKLLESSKKAHPTRAAAITEACTTLRVQILKMNELALSLVAKIDRDDDASVTVRGTVHEGTYIEICHVSHVVSRPLQHVKFVLDKHRGVVRAVALP